MCGCASQRGFDCVLFHACHTVNYMTHVYYLLRVNMVHANMYRDLVCLCCDAMHGHECKMKL